MLHRVAIAAMAAGTLVVGACADRDGGSALSTEPQGGSSAVQYVTKGTVAIFNRNTHRLEPVKGLAGAPSGASASIVGAGGAGPTVQVFTGAPGLAKTGGRGFFTFVDDNGRKHDIVLLYRNAGGPPAALQNYIDGVLVSTTSYVWQKTITGWARTQSVMQVVNKGALVGTFTTTSPVRPGTGSGPADVARLDRAPRVSPMQRAFGAAMYGLAYAFAPQDATAQGLSLYRCRVEWLRFSGAAIVVFAAGSALSSAPILTAFLLSSFVSAITSAAIAEDALLDCLLNYSQLSFSSFSSGGASVASDKWDCFGGSFSAHCTTAWTI
jgi:hypothetical protein